jgi:two-component system cell cycle sensor histidine kinase/response regulator CckA
VRKDGTEVPIDDSGAPIRDGIGKTMGVVLVFRDITERKQAEEEMSKAHDELELRVQERTAELQEANIKLETEVAERRRTEKALKKERDRAQQYLGIIGTALVIIGADQKVSLINKKGCGILGYKENEIVDKNWFDSFILERIRDNVKTVFKKLTAGEVEPVEYYENPVLTKSGEERLIAWHNTLLKDESGRNIAALSSGEDITEHRRAEEALRESEIRYHTLFDRSIDGVLIIDPETATTIEFNEAAHRHLGYTREEFKRLRIFDYEAEEKPEETKAHIEKVLREGRDDFETQHRTKDGRLRDIMVTVQTIKLFDRIFLYCIFHDITERKRAEEALKEREHSYRTLSENLPGIVYRVFLRENNRMQFFNNIVQPMTGFTEEELMAGDVCSLNHLILPEDRAQVVTTVKRAIMDNQPFQVEYLLRHKKGDIRYFLERGRPINGVDGNPLYIDGVIFDVTESKRAGEQIREQASLLDNAQEAIGKNADELLYKEEPPQLIEAKRIVLEKGEWMGELHQITKDGRELIIESRWTLVQDSKEEPKSILIINTDITEKKKLEAQLLRAQRMESIGTLAGGIAHDINNVLTPMMLSLQLLQEKFTDNESQKLINILERSTQCGASLVKQVQSFARGVQGERVALQVSHLISEIMQIAKETFPRSIEIRTDTQKDIWIISGDPTQLHQVIINMCVNARDAMPEGGILSISAENIFIDENYARMNIDAKVGQYVVITVSDTGTGIPPEILDRIFEPFFTTKQPGKGTGLGLSTSLAIVKSHSGFITVYSEVGKGTVFKVYLPVVKATEVQKVEEQLELLAGHGESILVVDDEAMVREITSSILETHGYRVLTANDGKEAIKVYKQNREKIKVVLMDMMMPVMDGQACIRALRKVNPEIKIIAVSGLAEKEKPAKVAVTQVKAFLPKPYAAKRLLKTIHEVISAK